MPVCTAVLSFAFGLERMGFLKAFGCALGFVGTVLAVRAHRIFDEVGPAASRTFCFTVTNVLVFVVRGDGRESHQKRVEDHGMTFLFRATVFGWTGIFFAGGLKQIFIDINWENGTERASQ